MLNENEFKFPKGSQYLFEGRGYRVLKAFTDSGLEYREVHSLEMGTESFLLSQLVKDMKHGKENNTWVLIKT